jgi:hypothetical protein
LYRQRRSPFLHVKVSGPGTWYARELEYYFRDNKISVVITNADSEISPDHLFSFSHPYPSKPSKPTFGFNLIDLNQMKVKDRRKLHLIRLMARLSHATTNEIALLSDISRTYVRQLLPDLQEEGYFEQINGFDGKSKKYPAWMITKRGIQYAHQSWSIPLNMRFKGIRGEQKYAGQRHRRVARIFKAWIQKAYGDDLVVWSAWTEPAFRGAYPDALVWGEYDGEEVLFWLECETGKKKTEKIKTDIMRRYDQAVANAIMGDIKIVFVVLSLPWVLKSLDASDGYEQYFKPSKVFPPQEMIAVILENWRNFGDLNTPEFGYCRYANDSFSFTSGGDDPELRLGFGNDKVDPKIFLKYRRK